MQTAYQFPERVERLVLISSGGLGTEVTPVLRLASTTVLSVGSLVPGFTPRTDIAALISGVKRLREPRQQRASSRTARSVIVWRGQSVSAIKHLRTFRRHARASGAVGTGHFPHETEPIATATAIRRFLRESDPYRFDEDARRQSFPGSPALRDVAV